MNFIFSLDKSTPTKLFQCPECQHKTLKRYWDNHQKEYLPDIVGRCNREGNCGYHLSPKQYFKNIGKEFPTTYSPKVFELPKRPEPTFIDKSLIKKSMNGVAPNYFVEYLNSLFQKELTQQLINLFRIGSAKHWHGASVFWQIDQNNNVRTGKVMLYNSQTGRRVKEPYPHIHWVHSLAKLPNFQLSQCLFGLHQIRDDLDRPIGIVESEKTAILLSALYPKLTWLASGGMNLSFETFEPLKDKQITLYPDAGIDNGKGTPFDKWTDKADTLRLKGFNVSVSKIIENQSTTEQRKRGYDLADFLIKTDNTGLALNDNDYPIFWD